MANSQVAPVLLLNGDRATPRLVEREPPSSRRRLLLGILLYLGPLMVVGHWLWGFVGDPILPAPLSFLLAASVALGWYAMLSGGSHLHKLEIDAAIRVETSALAGLHRRETRIDRARVSGLRLENLLSEGPGSIVEGGGNRNAHGRNPRRGLTALQRTVLQLTVTTDDGEHRKYVFRSEEIQTPEQIEELFSKIAAALGFSDVRLESRDSRKVVVSAGAVASVRGNRPVNAEAERHPAAGPTRDSRQVAGTKLGRHRVVAWNPPSILITRQWGKSWLLWPIVAAFLVGGWFFIGPYLQWFLEAQNGTSLERGMEQVAGGTWVESRGIEITLQVMFVLMLIQLWLDRPGRIEIDSASGVAHATGRLTRRAISLSSVQAVRLKEEADEPSSYRSRGPFTLTLELVPREEVQAWPFPLVRIITQIKRDRIYGQLSPMAQELADALDVPYWSEKPDGTSTMIGKRPE